MVGNDERVFENQTGLALSCKTLLKEFSTIARFSRENRKPKGKGIQRIFENQ